MVCFYLFLLSKENGMAAERGWLSPSKSLGSNLNPLVSPLFPIIIAHSHSRATFLYTTQLKVFLFCFWSLYICDWGERKRGLQKSVAPHAKVWISLKTLSAPSATRNKACAGLSGNPACEALVSEVICRQQMNPVVGVVGAMMERRRRQRSSFSQVIQGDSNEAEWRKKPERLIGWRQEPGCVDKLQYQEQQKGRWGREGYI